MNPIDEKKAREVSDDRFLSPAESSKVLRELREAQIELKVQNDALRKAQEAIEESRDRYVHLYEFAPIGYLILDSNGVIVEANATSAALLGVERKKLLKSPFLIRLGSEESDRWMRCLLDLRLRGGRSSTELTLRRGDGTTCQCQADCEWRISDATIWITLIDITERNQAERALREQEKTFREVVDHGHALVWMSGLDKGCHYFNRPWLVFTGRTLEQEFGNGWAEGVHPDDLQRCLDIYVTAFDRHEAFSMTYRLRRNDGEYRWVLDDGAPRYDDTGLFVGYIGHCLDVTEQKNAEEASKESDQRWQFALEGAGAGVWDWNIRTGVAFYSRRYKEMLGFAENEIGETSHEWTKRIHPDDAPLVFAELQPYMEGKPGSATVEFRMLCKDGSWRWILGRGMVIASDADGKPLRMIGTNTDITKRKQAEEALRESELRFSLFMENLPACAYIKDAQSRHIFVNAALASQAKATVGSLLGKTNGDLWPKKIAAKLDSADAAVITSGVALTIEEDVLMNNEVRTYRTTKFPIGRSNGETYLAGVSFDITERKQAEAKVKLAATVFSHAREGITITDAAGTIIDVNATFSDITGYSHDEVIGKNPRILSSGRHGQEFYSDLWRDLTVKGNWCGEIWNRRKNGEVYAEMLTISTVRSEDGRTPQYYVGLFSDITERKQMEDQLHNLAFYDSLTTLPNRRLLKDRLQQTTAVNRRSGCYGALLFLDLDNFKPLNDVQGHEVGDLLLVEAANRLKGCVREMDTVARFGGDEFVVMISELNGDKAESIELVSAIAEKVRGALSEPYLLTVKRDDEADVRIEHYCTASIGVALFVNHQANQDEIIKWADTAMYQAKKAGRNMIRFHESTAA